VAENLVPSGTVPPQYFYKMQDRTDNVEIKKLLRYAQRRSCRGIVIAQSL